jgi:C-terminal processing protease CtpA/Prc
MFLDYGRNRIILEPMANLREPFGVASAGMAVRTEGDHFTFRVKEVLDKGPASDAGVQAGDLITAVNGTPASQLTLTKLIEMFEKPLTYELVLKRGDQELKVRLTPRRVA